MKPVSFVSFPLIMDITLLKDRIASSPNQELKCLVIYRTIMGELVSLVKFLTSNLCALLLNNNERNTALTLLSRFYKQSLDCPCFFELLRHFSLT